MKQEIFRMERVTYMENGVVMLQDFHLQIWQGEILGMVPMNNYGMSSFLNLLRTNLSLHDGYVYYCGEKVNSWKGPARPANRISVIQAKSSLVERMTVTDNIFVLRQGFHQELIRSRLLRQQMQPFMEDIGMEIPGDRCVEELSVFERVVVELLRAVILGNRLIVLSEIGALISYEEVGKLHEIIRHYASQGFSFLYICSHLEEISRICDRVARVSNGRVQKIIQKAEMEAEIMRICPDEYRSMVQYHRENRPRVQSSGTVLTWSQPPSEESLGFLFQVHCGECLVLQAVENKQFQQISRILTGKQPMGETCVTMDGSRIRSVPGDSQIAVVQELAARTMLFPELSYMENLCMSLARRMPFLWLNHKICRNIRNEYEAFLGKETFDLPVSELSEKQKYQLIYTRVLLQKPRVVFCIHPFQGADVAHRMFIWSMLELLLAQGIAVVIVSVSLSDSLALADRLIILEQDGSRKELPREKFETISAKVPWTHLYSAAPGLPGSGSYERAPGLYRNGSYYDTQKGSSYEYRSQSSEENRADQ